MKIDKYKTSHSAYCDLFKGHNQCTCLADEVERLKAERDGWIKFAAIEANNTVYYRGLIEEAAKLLGVEMYTADDGTIYDSPLALKLPEVIKKLLERRKRKANAKTSDGA